MKVEIEDGVYADWDFNAPKPPKCKNCKRDKGSHKHISMNCPIGRGSFPQFLKDQFYEPRVNEHRQDTKSRKE